MKVKVLEGPSNELLIGLELLFLQGMQDRHLRTAFTDNTYYLSYFGARD